MQCSGCQHENREGRRFCAECGASLAFTCPSCGFSNEPGEKFCGGCGAPLGAASAGTAPDSRFSSPQSYTPKHLAEKILTSKAALEGERKQVTVLFADLKGSMELLAGRDPEEARKLLDPVLEHMMEAVHRYEGTVNQVMGDGIMALFGAPLAHEDHAVRACYAALRMQESVKRYAEAARRDQGVNVQIRVGLNSGEVVVRAIGSDLRMDYTAVGQTTHLAARMEQLAAPGTSLLTASTLALVEGLVAVTSLGPVSIKGILEPLEVFELTGAGQARTRLQAAARRGLTQFVGRDTEVQQLRRAHDLASKGHGQVVALVGEAGVGKSRLVYEFVHSHRLQGWLVLETASVSYGKATSYLPVIDLLKSYFAIHESDDIREIREKVTSKILSLDRRLEATIPAILALLDALSGDSSWQALDPPRRRQETLDAVKQLLLREAREQPVVAIFEDLHWIDTETQALLDALVESLDSQRFLLLVDHRPEYQHPWSSKTYFGQIRLNALPPESAAEFLGALLGNDVGLTPLKSTLVKRGNPFFLEETVRSLLETKSLAGERGQYRLTQAVQRVETPPTVQAVLAARIDRLDPEDKHILQIASVIGKEVPFALLQAISEVPDGALRRTLEHLRGAEFLYETGLYPDLQYSFKHALTHDVTYGGLLQDRRRALHGQIVEALEALHPDRLDEQIERLAHHALRGLHREKAVTYLRRAGLKAAARFALPDARLWLEQALDVLESLDKSHAHLEEAFDIRLELRPVLTLLGATRRSLECLRDAEARAEQLNDDRRRGWACAIMVNNLGSLGEHDDAFLAGARALDIANSLGDLRLRVCASSYLAQTHWICGDYSQAIELAQGNLSTLPSDWTYEHFGNAAPASIFDRGHLTASLAQLGRFAEAERYRDEARRLAEAMHHTWSVALVYWYSCYIPLVRGEWKLAKSVVEQGISALRTGNIGTVLPNMVAASAWIQAELGDTEGALARLQEAQLLAQRFEPVQYFSGGGFQHGAFFLGRACLRIGQLDEARNLAERLVGALSKRPGAAARSLHLLADVASHSGARAVDRAEGHYREALALAESSSMRPLVAHCHLGLGKLYQRVGKQEQSHEHLTTATKMYYEMDMRFWVEQAEADRDT